MTPTEFKTHMRTEAMAHASVDFEKMYELAKHVHETPGALDEFSKDPEGFAFRFNGLVPQPGQHMHIADKFNNLYPAEEEGVFGEETRQVWGRTEIRVGYKTTALVVCA